MPILERGLFGPYRRMERTDVLPILVASLAAFAGVALSVLLQGIHWLLGGVGLAMGIVLSKHLAKNWRG